MERLMANELPSSIPICTCRKKHGLIVLKINDEQQWSWKSLDRGTSGISESGSRSRAQEGPTHTLVSFLNLLSSARIVLLSPEPRKELTHDRLCTAHRIWNDVHTRTRLQMSHGDTHRRYKKINQHIQQVCGSINTWSFNRPDFPLHHSGLRGLCGPKFWSFHKKVLEKKWSITI